MDVNDNILNEILLYMKTKDITKISKSKENILWKRLLYRDFNIIYNKQDSYDKYYSYKSFLNKLELEYLSSNNTLTQEIIDYIGVNDDKWDWKFISVNVNLSIKKKSI